MPRPMSSVQMRTQIPPDRKARTVFSRCCSDLGNQSHFIRRRVGGGDSTVILGTGCSLIGYLAGYGTGTDHEWQCQISEKVEFEAGSLCFKFCIITGRFHQPIQER